MTIVLAVLAVIFAAVCVWLTVRIVNRRERWAKRTLAVVIGVPALYVASFGPACRGFSWGIISEDRIKRAYNPILAHEGSIPAILRRLVSWYSAPAEYDNDMIVFLNQADSRRETERLRKKLEAQLKETSELLDALHAANDDMRARLRALEADSQALKSKIQ